MKHCSASQRKSQRDLATTRLVTNRSTVTGTQMARSQKLGVRLLAITPSPQYATTSQTSLPQTPFHRDTTMPARIRTISASANKRNTEPTEASRICIGSTPGNFPPHANAPHGTPAASASWNNAVPVVSAAKRRAAFHGFTKSRPTDKKFNRMRQSITPWKYVIKIRCYRLSHAYPVGCQSIKLSDESICRCRPPWRLQLGRYGAQIAVLGALVTRFHQNSRTQW